jgi:ubiquinone/menaquinone biosynthesis C-methylase UbiE
MRKLHSDAPLILSPLDGHERWADSYDNTPNPLLHLEERELAAVLPDVTALAIADLACGTGRWLSRFARGGPQQYIGVDFSFAMLRQAARRAEVKGHLIQARVEDIPIRTGTFDLVLCSFVLGYIKNLDAVVDETHRLLGPSGRLFLTDLHPDVERLGWKRSFTHRGQTVEVENCFHPIEEIVRSFQEQFELIQRRDCFLSEHERPIFVASQRLDIYEQAQGVPAVVLLEWRKSLGTREAAN